MNLNLHTTRRARRLSDKLRSFFKNAKRVVVIGMGNELRADDAVGLEVVRHLKPYEGDKLVVFEGHTTPEAFVSPTCAAKPTHLLIVDAAELGELPGAWRFLSKDEINEVLFTTHAIPATEVAAEIQRRCGAKVAFLGIQPKIRDVSLSVSRECKKTADEVAKIILDSF
jgi:hydrogenase 3 maturation protease